MKAREIMTPDPSVVTPTDSITHAAEMMRRLSVGSIPVVDDRATMRLEGIITDRDIAIRCVAFGHGARCRVQDHMTSDALDTARPDSDVNDVMHMMEHDQVRRIPVVADGNRLVGIIAQADVVTRLSAEEPRTVGELVAKISEPVPASLA